MPNAKAKGNIYRQRGSNHGPSVREESRESRRHGKVPVRFGGGRLEKDYSPSTSLAAYPTVSGSGRACVPLIPGAEGSCHAVAFPFPALAGRTEVPGNGAVGDRRAVAVLLRPLSGNRRRPRGSPDPRQPFSSFSRYSRRNVGSPQGERNSFPAKGFGQAGTLFELFDLFEQGPGDRWGPRRDPRRPFWRLGRSSCRDRASLKASATLFCKGVEEGRDP
jgi:hypothetical protein